MPPKSNNLGQFWQELKRRKVIRRNMVYAATGFMILEFVSIVAEPLGLPPGTLKFVFIILCAGLIISFILSWIYDITPDGIEKTKPAHKVIDEDEPANSISWKIASYISFGVIVGLIIFHIATRSSQKRDNENLEKSIAVLPFENMSSDGEYGYIGGAFTDEIIMELQKIKEFDRVLSRTSTMQYEKNRPTIPEIAEKLNVNYLVEGSIQRLEDDVRIRIQVIRAKNEDHIWGDEYDRKWKDIFSIQDEIAYSVANELKTVITPEEKQLIDKIPTTNLTAYELYHKGQEEFYTYYMDKDKMEALLNAKAFYRSALESDPAFAKAYTGLAQVFWYQLGFRWEGKRPENGLDSVRILAEMGLNYDDQLVDGYILMGDYYSRSGKRALAIEEYDKALKLNPNHWTAYHQLGTFYLGYDFVKSIQYYYKAASLIHGPEEPAWLRRGIWQSHNHIGLIEKSNSYLLKALKLDRDSLEHYVRSTQTERHSGNFNKAIALARKGYAIDSTKNWILTSLAWSYFYLGQYEESIKYINKYSEIHGPLAGFNLYLGYAYWKIESEKEAEKQFLDLTRQLNRWKEQGEDVSESWRYYELACGYSFMGEKDKAYENLRMYIKKMHIPHREQVLRFKIDPFFDNIRKEAEFQKIARKVETKYQAEHERVKQWLEENEMQ